jgi:hypothetical protein
MNPGEQKPSRRWNTANRTQHRAQRPLFALAAMASGLRLQISSSEVQMHDSPLFMPKTGG